MTSSSRSAGPGEEAGSAGEDLVEALLAQVGLVQRRREERGATGGDVGGVASGRRGGHRRRPVESDHPSAAQPFADQRDRRSVAASDLEHAVSRPHVELPDRPGEPRRRLNGHRA